MYYGTFDIESRHWTQFELLGCYLDNSFSLHNDIFSFFRRLSIRKDKRWLRMFAHNGGRFDFLFILEPLMETFGESNLDITMQGSRIVGIRVPQIKVEFSDSAALLKDKSLEALLKDFGVEEQKYQIENFDTVTRAELEKRVESDCIGLFQVIDEVQHFFASEFAMANLSRTIASQAFRVFKSHFGNPFQLQGELFDNSIRQNFLVGGRVEVFRGKGAGLNHYDIVSLYPYVMRNFPFPCGRVSFVRTQNRKRLGFYRFNADIPESNVLLTSVAFDYRRYYVYGKGTYYGGTYLIQELRDQGIDCKVIDGWEFPSSCKPFDGYVDFFFKLKNQGNGTEKVMAKYMLNALSGKFSQKIIQQVGLRRGEKAFDSQLGFEVLGTGNVEEFMVPYVTAWITEIARIHHTRMLKNCGSNLWYCDTDSIFTTEKLRNGNGLGELKLEKKVKNAIFLAPKTYACDDVIHFKGFGNTSFTFEQFNSALKDSMGLLQFENRILTLKAALKSKRVGQFGSKVLKRIPTTKTAFPEIITRKKVYDSRSVFKTNPYSIQELTERNELNESNSRIVFEHLQER